jgi:hypothetical protein
MARQLAQKKIKMEIEFTVTLNAIDAAGTAAPAGPDGSFLTLEQMQKALAENEAVLAQQMIAAAFSKLQEYAGFLTAQDTLTPLRELAQALPPADQEPLGLTRADFIDATRLLRQEGLSARVDASRVAEQLAGDGCCPVWAELWSDLRPGSDLGRQMEHYYVPQTPPTVLPEVPGHYFQARYLTRQGDAVHVEGCCTCGEVVHGAGAEMTAALAAAWSGYEHHLALCQMGERTNLHLHPTSQPSKQ